MHIHTQKTAAFILTFFVVASTLLAQDVKITRPEKVGMSSERLDRISPKMQQFIDENRISGMVTLIARKGKIVHLEANGMMDIENGIPMRTDALFRIASMSKAVTSAAAMILFEEGAFMLDDPVSQYIPEFAGQQVIALNPDGTTRLVPVTQEITVRHLMTHTSGIPYGHPLLRDRYSEARIYSGTGPTEGTIGEMVRRLATQPILFNPGERWEYGLNIDVLGRLVELWSGQSLAEFMRERIFEPLGMQDTFFSVPADKLNRLANVYIRSDSGLTRKPDDQLPPTDTAYYSGGAGLVTTATDYLRFCLMVLNRGELDGVRILGRKTAEFMTAELPDSKYLWEGRDGVRATHGDKHALAGGIRTDRNYIDSIGSFSWGGAFHTLFWVDFEEEMAGVFMSQLQGPYIRLHHRTFKNMAYQAIVE